MSQTSNSPKMVSFFAKFICSEILTLPEILFWHVEIIVFLLCRNYEAKSRNFKFLTKNWYKSEFSSLIFSKFYLNNLHNDFNKNTYNVKKITGHRVSFRTLVVKFVK